MTCKTITKEDIEGFVCSRAPLSSTEWLEAFDRLADPTSEEQ